MNIQLTPLELSQVVSALDYQRCDLDRRRIVMLSGDAPDIAHDLLARSLALGNLAERLESSALNASPTVCPVVLAGIAEDYCDDLGGDA